MEQKEGEEKKTKSGWFSERKKGKNSGKKFKKKGISKKNLIGM